MQHYNCCIIILLDYLVFTVIGSQNQITQPDFVTFICSLWMSAQNPLVFTKDRKLKERFTDTVSVSEKAPSFPETAGHGSSYQTLLKQVEILR